MDFTHIATPAALLDVCRMQGNITSMQKHTDALGVAFRPHVKTSKSAPVIKAQLEAGAQGVTVSTLKEAEQCFAAGITDILYAVGIAPAKLAQAHALMQRGCHLKIITDNSETACAIAAYGKSHDIVFEVLIEIDVDGHRSGIKPESAELLHVGKALCEKGVTLAGVLTHAGESYAACGCAAVAVLAEEERARCVRAAERLRAYGLPCPIVSVGSTPTAVCAKNLAGVTEMRAGVYVFFDLVMYNIGVCNLEDISLSVLTTVIGHQREKGWAITDAGWMAMSRDRGTASQATDFGYGLVCDVMGNPLPTYSMSGANQEHGIISLANGKVDADIAKKFPVGTLLRIVPNHACATGAQFPEYYALKKDGKVEVWPRFYGW